MSDVIAAPDENVIANFRARLDDSVLEYETIVTNLGVPEIRGPRTDVADQLIPFRLAFIILPGSELIQLLIAHCNKHFEVIWRAPLRHLFKRNNRTPKQLFFRQVCAVYRERGNIVGAVVRQVVVGLSRDFARPENNNLTHPQDLSSRFSPKVCFNQLQSIYFAVGILRKKICAMEDRWDHVVRNNSPEIST